MGYARSKWVTENLVAKAAISRGIRAESFRLGQMVGDTVNGVWNETEAISLLVKSAQTIGAMPDLGEVSQSIRLLASDHSTNTYSLDVVLASRRLCSSSMHRSDQRIARPDTWHGVAHP
jgi:thioester reductase-like protein